jgi:hypothetical protein
MKKVLLGAFLLGSAYGALQTDHPWRGGGIIPNIGLVTGSGLVVTLLVTMVWSLNALRKRAAALIWRQRA